MPKLAFWVLANCSTFNMRRLHGWGNENSAFVALQHSSILRAPSDHFKTGLLQSNNLVGLIRRRQLGDRLFATLPAPATASNRVSAAANSCRRRATVSPCNRERLRGNWRPPSG